MFLGLSGCLGGGSRHRDEEETSASRSRSDADTRTATSSAAHSVLPSSSSSNSSFSIAGPVKAMSSVTSTPFTDPPSPRETPQLREIQALQGAPLLIEAVKEKIIHVTQPNDDESQLGNFNREKDASDIADFFFTEKMFLAKNKKDEAGLRLELYRRILPTQAFCQNIVRVTNGLAILKFYLFFNFIKDHQRFVIVNLRIANILQRRGLLAYIPDRYNRFSAKLKVLYSSPPSAASTSSSSAATPARAISIDPIHTTLGWRWNRATKTWHEAEIPVAEKNSLLLYNHPAVNEALENRMNMMKWGGNDAAAYSASIIAHTFFKENVIMAVFYGEKQTLIKDLSASILPTQHTYSDMLSTTQGLVILRFTALFNFIMSHHHSIVINPSRIRKLVLAEKMAFPPPSYDQFIEELNTFYDTPTLTQIPTFATSSTTLKKLLKPVDFSRAASALKKDAIGYSNADWIWHPETQTWYEVAIAHPGRQTITRLYGNPRFGVAIEKREDIEGRNHEQELSDKQDVADIVNIFFAEQICMMRKGGDQKKLGQELYEMMLSSESFFKNIMRHPDSLVIFSFNALFEFIKKNEYAVVVSLRRIRELLSIGSLVCSPTEYRKFAANVGKLNYPHEL